VDRVAGAVEDSWDTCPGREVRTCGGLVVDPRKTTQHYGRRGFNRVCPQNSVVAVPVGIRGDTWRHHEGCVMAKQLCLDRVAYTLVSCLENPSFHSLVEPKIQRCFEPSCLCFVIFID
jgi:hypothetical protein